MATTAARTASPSAAVLAETASTWNAWFDGALNASNDAGVYGPYLIVAASTGASSILTPFVRTPIPNLDPDTGLVDSGRWSLFVLPVCVYRRAAVDGRSRGREFLVSTCWAPTPTDALPTDADLGAVLVRAMSARADSPPTLGDDNVWTPVHGWEPGELAGAVAAAVEKIGWRAAAAVAIAACGNKYTEPAEVAAVLTALTSSPSHGG